jgi:hypothetical protein
MPQALPARNILDGTALPSTSTMKTALGQLRDYLAETLGPTGGVFSAGLKNRFINGAMKIDQRNAGASQTITAGAALAYTVDRWYAYCTGANVTGQQFSSGALKRYRLTGAASVTGVGFAQRIEAANSMDLASNTVTLSIKASSSSLTTLNWAAYHATTADSFGSLASPTRTSIASGSFTITATEAAYNAQISMPAGATTGVEVVFTAGALLAGQTLTLGDAQLELGGVVTSFEAQRPLGLERALCEWYLRPAPLVRYAGYVGALQNVITFTTFPSMRVAPALTGASYSQSNATGAALGNFTSSGCTFSATASAAGPFDISLTAGVLSSEL